MVALNTPPNAAVQGEIPDSKSGLLIKFASDSPPSGSAASGSLPTPASGSELEPELLELEHPLEL